MAESTKSVVCKKTYQVPGADDTTHASDDAASITFKFANGKTAIITPEDFPENVQRCLVFFGISEKLGNAFAGATKAAKESGESAADVAHEMFEALRERLVLGEWIAEREAAGPRITLLVEAIVAALEAAGREADPVKIGETLRGDKEKRDNALDNPAFRAQYDRIRAEKAIERADVSAKVAADAGEADLGAF